TVAVRPPAVGCYQQPRGVRIGGLAHLVPPTPDRRHGELGGVCAPPDAHPTGVRGDVIDPIRRGLTQFLVWEVVGVDLHRPAHSLPLPAAGRKVAHQRGRPPGEEPAVLAPAPVTPSRTGRARFRASGSPVTTAWVSRLVARHGWPRDSRRRR